MNWFKECPNCHRMVLKDLDVCNYCNYNFKGFDMKKILVLVILISSWCFGAYDGTDAEVIVGGYGYQAVNGDSVTGYGKTMGDNSFTVLAAGKLTRIIARLYDGGTATSIFKIKVLRGGSSPYTLVGEIDCTAHMVARQGEVTNATRFEYDTSATYAGVSIDVAAANIDMQVGDFVAFTTGTTSTVAFIRKTCAGATVISGNGDVEDLPTSAADTAMICDIYTTTGQKCILDDSTIAVESMEIPVFTEGYHITIEDIDLSEDDAITFALTNNADTLGTITIDTDAETIAFGESSESVTFLEADNVNIDIWIDPVNNRADVMYFNYATGCGSQSSDYDVRAKSVTSRSPISFTGTVKNITITQTVGTGAAISRIIVHYKPVLCMSDSFGSTYSDGKTILAHIGNRLDNEGCFTKVPYVYNGGITGSKVLLNQTDISTAIRDRWNSATSEWCAIHDCVVVFLNGPGLNDVSALSALSTSQDISDLAGRLAGSIGRMVGDAIDSSDTYGGRNDVIMCGQVAYTVHTGAELSNEQACQLKLNKALRVLANTFNIPYVDSWNVATDGTHPTTAGDIDYAQRIVEAYEQNKVPYSAGTGWLAY